MLELSHTLCQCREIVLHIVDAHVALHPGNAVKHLLDSGSRKAHVESFGDGSLHLVPQGRLCALHSCFAHGSVL